MEEPILDDDLFTAELTTLERHRLRNLEEQAEDLGKKVKAGRIALFILSGLSLVAIFLFINMDFSLEEALFEGLISFAIYMGLAILSFRYPVVGIGLGLLIYLAVQIITIISVPESMIRGIILKVLFIYYLITGFIAARRLKPVQTELDKLLGVDNGPSFS